MSTRWMAVQYVGNTLRLPVVNEGDMERSFGSSVLERDVQRIVVNPFSDNPRTFVHESENAKPRELLIDILAYGSCGGFTCSEGTWSCPYFQECFNCPIEEGPEKYVRRGCRWLARGRELGVEVAQ